MCGCGRNSPPHSLGSFRFLWAVGIGSDVMKRIAAPMVGGILASFLLELLVYPSVYRIWKWNFELKKELAALEK
jgi:copper/silver efflux system protein